ncbi:sensor histidine kinase [Salinigranum rubrum]|uniref:sensor histidine kinase n=1 Tax=Salinigranum rubrum TaxID=755307 RepID=UPI001FE8A5D3|nr:HAMP domain-containing sensor histidine kinase [Salinigranum rubrum]
MPLVLVGLGTAFVLLIVVEWIALDLLRPSQSLTAHYVFTFTLNGVPALGIAYGGYWLDRSPVETDQHRRIARWCFGGLAVFLAINLVMIALWPAETFVNNLGWARGTAIYGAGGGLVIGVIEGRAVHRARVAEREAARAEHVENQRRWLGYMNSLLRHEVLNTVNIIEGNAELLMDEYGDDPSSERLETIRRHSRNMSGIINDVRVLIEATEEADEFEAVNLTEVLTDRLIDLRTTYEEVEVETTIPGTVFVMADALLPRVFSNLLNNAVEHNDSATPRVSVSVEVTDETAVVSIADNGSGVSAAKQETLFEQDTRTSNHGLGLYLVRTLSERYGGRVDLRETGPTGSEFVVELPRVRDTPAGHSGERAMAQPLVVGTVGTGRLVSGGP